MSDLLQIQSEAITDGRNPTDLDWRTTARIVVPASNRRRILDREAAKNNHPDQWGNLCERRHVGYDDELGEDVVHWCRIRWVDPRLTGVLAVQGT